MSGIGVRPYEVSDREAVREICFRTGYMGDPIDWQWADMTSFADIWVGWYVDNEPESAWVLDRAGEVLGYLVGCRDTRNGPNLPALFGSTVMRRLLPLRPGTAGYIWRAAADLIRDRQVPPASPDLERWPAHLHIDLLEAARGSGAGRRLMETWLDRLREERVPGVHLGTIAENARAVAFFEAMGFRRHGVPVLVPGERAMDGGRLHALTLVQDL